MAEKTVIKTKYEKLVNEIIWDNWEKTELDKTGGCSILGNIGSFILPS